jgi:hypothetical protein
MIDGVVKGCPHHILEPQRLQLVQYSEDFSNAYWTKSRASITNNSLISPDGTLNASKFTQTTSTAWGGVVLTITPSGNSTLSIFAKKIDNDYIAIIGHNSNDTKVYFNLDNGTIGTVGADVTNADIQDYGNGWYRCVLIASSINRFTVLHSTTDNGNTANLNTETSLWGAMLEQGPYPTSYIPNYGTGAGVTRSAETANGSGDAATFNDSEGVLMAEISGFVDTDDYRMISLNAGSSSNTLFIGLRNDTGNVYFYLISGTNQANYISDVNATNTNIKLAVKYKENDVSFYVNGIKLYSTNSATMISGLNQLEFGYGNGNPGSYPFYGNTKQLQYFDTALTDSELEQLTSWVSFTDMAEAQLYSVE